MSFIGLGKIKKTYEDIILPTGEVKHCEVVYRLGWMFYQDKIVVGYIPVKAGGTSLTNVVYTVQGWTANECKQRFGRSPQVGR